MYPDLRSRKELQQVPRHLIRAVNTATVSAPHSPSLVNRDTAKKEML